MNNIYVAQKEWWKHDNCSELFIFIIQMIPLIEKCIEWPEECPTKIYFLLTVWQFEIKNVNFLDAATRAAIDYGLLAVMERKLVGNSDVMC